VVVDVSSRYVGNVWLLMCPELSMDSKILTKNLVSESNSCTTKIVKKYLFPFIKVSPVKHFNNINCDICIDAIRY
jgi:hypothetical protein